MESWIGLFGQKLTRCRQRDPLRCDTHKRSSFSCCPRWLVFASQSLPGLATPNIAVLGHVFVVLLELERRSKDMRCSSTSSTSAPVSSSVGWDRNHTWASYSILVDNSSRMERIEHVSTGIGIGSLGVRSKVRGRTLRANKLLLLHRQSRSKQIVLPQPKNASAPSRAS